MKVLVSRGTYGETIAHLSTVGVLSLDTETTGLKPYRGDRLFSVVIGDKDNEYYFNFNEYEDMDSLGDDLQADLMRFITNWRGKLWILHNAKFDMHILAQEGCTLNAPIHDTMIVGRLLENTARNFDLASMLEAIGLKKDDAVMAYIKANPDECQRRVKSEHRGKTETLLDFAMVPFKMMFSYACDDARGTYALGTQQYLALQELDKVIHPSHPRPTTAYKIEQELLPVVMEMEKVGVKIDRDFCLRAAAYEKGQAAAASAKFEELTGAKYVSSAKALKPVFEGKEEIEFTAKGNAKFSADVLEKYESEEAKLILKVRDHTSKANFYLSFLDFADKDDVIHGNFNQTGTTTGRFSSSEPNLQNLTKQEGDDLKEEFVVRRAFIPREDFFFAMFDYDQMEYRLALDVAGETTLIDKVLGGLDVHMATAELAGIERPRAKTINFGILYGEGDKKLAKDLNVPLDTARELKDKVFSAAPRLERLIGSLVKAAKTGNRRVLNWCGFILNYQTYRMKDDKGETIVVDPSYKAPNGYIQGGCAYVMKLAMIDVFKYLRDKKSRLVMTIHDELVVETHIDEVYILPKIKEIMESVYPYKRLPLTTGLEHSFKSLADKVEGCPSLLKKSQKLT